MSVYPFIESFSSAYAVALSLQIEDALEQNQQAASKGLFGRICNDVTNKFLFDNFGGMPNTDLEAFLNQVKLSSELVQKYLGQVSDPNTKEITFETIRQLNLPDTEEPKVASPAEEKAPEQSVVAGSFSYLTSLGSTLGLVAAEEEKFIDPTSMTPEQKITIPGPWSFMASFGPIPSLLSLEIKQALEADLEQAEASAETRSVARMGAVCCQTAKKFIESNLDNPVDVQELLFEVEFPTQLVQKYLNVTFPGNSHSVSLKEIQQVLEPSVEGSSDTLTQEIDEILPSLETHFEEASRRAEAEEAAKIEAEQKAARIAAEEEAKKAAAASQGLLASLPSISSFFGSTPTATVAT